MNHPLGKVDTTKLSLHEYNGYGIEVAPLESGLYVFSLVGPESDGVRPVSYSQETFLGHTQAFNSACKAVNPEWLSDQEKNEKAQKEYDEKEEARLRKEAEDEQNAEDMRSA